MTWGRQQMRAARWFVPAIAGWLIIAGAGPLAATAPPPADQAAPSRLRQHMRAGGQFLGKEDYPAALTEFQHAAEVDPQSAEAHFFIGLTLNRLDRPREVLDHLKQAGALAAAAPPLASGAKPPAYISELSFEMGWSLIYLLRWTEAIEQLHQYEATSPGRGKTSEFLGRAWLALGQFDRGESLLSQAVRRDPDLMHTVELYRAAAEDQRKNSGAAIARLIDVGKLSPESPTGRLFRQNLASDPLAPVRPWWLEGSLAPGFTTNALGARSRFVSPSGGAIGVRQQDMDSAFVRFTLDAGCTLTAGKTEAGGADSGGGAADRLSIGYRLLADTYDRDARDADLMDHYLYVEAERHIGGPFTAQLRLWDDYTLSGDSNYRNEIAGRITLLDRLTTDLVAEAGYTYAFDDYLVTVPLDIFDGGRLNQDAQSHSLTLAVRWTPPRIPVEIRLGYYHTWNFARGDDFDFDADGAFAGLRIAPLFGDIAAEALYSHTREAYVDPNSVSNPFVRRADDIDALSVRLTKPLGTNLSLYVQYDYTQDNSNVPIYEYRQHSVVGGVIWRF